jgi:formamidopyrimidine-DNA glycosylase
MLLFKNMPELPEVETVCRNLNEIIAKNSKILAWQFWRKDLRFSLPIKQLETLKSEKLRRIYRRAKYIVFEFDSSAMISHLGMTGQWSNYSGEFKKYDKKKHDHVGFEFSKNQWLIYNDPRRFGFIHFVKNADRPKYFFNVGLEPLDINTDLNSLNPTFKKLKTNIKAALMNQKYVVGVGNIYASEVLFRSKINPLKICSKVTLVQYEKLWTEVCAVLSEAINSGGSTILIICVWA